MKFRVVRKYDNMPMMGTEYESCISFEYLDSQEAAGYYFTIDGKKYTADGVRKYFGRSKSGNGAAQHSSETQSLQKPKRKVRPIKCINTLNGNTKVYDNMSACARDLGIDPAAVSYAMQKNKPTSGGYAFEFAD